MCPWPLKLIYSKVQRWKHQVAEFRSSSYDRNEIQTVKENMIWVMYWKIQPSKVNRVANVDCWCRRTSRNTARHWFLDTGSIVNQSLNPKDFSTKHPIHFRFSAFSICIIPILLGLEYCDFFSRGSFIALTPMCARHFMRITTLEICLIER